jgi:uncharacterized protein YlxW (UPF0749 family)
MAPTSDARIGGGHVTDRPALRTRPDESMSLLTDLFQTATDDGYTDAARVRAERAATQGEPAVAPTPSSVWRTPRVRAAVLLTIGVAILGLLFATTAIQARRAAPAAAAERASLVERIEAMRDRAADLRAELATAETTLAEAQDDVLNTTAEGEALRTELDQLELTSGAAAVVGPGLVVTLDDAAVERDGDTNLDDTRVQDIDVRQVLNGLWSAGAEAISIDGTRVTSRTSIRAAGDALFADLAPLRPPYEIRAIGNPETLGPRFLDSAGASWLQVLAATYGIEFEVSTASTVEIPAVRTLDLTWASSVTGLDQ